MRLLEVTLQDWRSIHDGQTVSLGGLTVLFGANSSGKTNVLTGVEAALDHENIDWTE